MTQDTLSRFFCELAYYIYINILVYLCPVQRGAQWCGINVSCHRQAHHSALAIAWHHSFY